MKKSILMMAACFAMMITAEAQAKQEIYPVPGIACQVIIGTESHPRCQAYCYVRDAEAAKAYQHLATRLPFSSNCICPNGIRYQYLDPITRIPVGPTYTSDTNHRDVCRSDSGNINEFI